MLLPNVRQLIVAIQHAILPHMKLAGTPMLFAAPLVQLPRPVMEMASSLRLAMMHVMFLPLQTTSLMAMGLLLL